MTALGESSIKLNIWFNHHQLVFVSICCWRYFFLSRTNCVTFAVLYYQSCKIITIKWVGKFIFAFYSKMITSIVLLFWDVRCNAIDHLLVKVCLKLACLRNQQYAQIRHYRILSVFCKENFKVIAIMKNYCLDKCIRYVFDFEM